MYTDYLGMISIAHRIVSIESLPLNLDSAHCLLSIAQCWPEYNVCTKCHQNTLLVDSATWVVSMTMQSSVLYVYILASTDIHSNKQTSTTR